MLRRQMKSVKIAAEEIDDKRLELRTYFHQSFDLFESLFALFVDEAVFYRQSEPTRHPMIFYFGHTAVFYVNKLVLAGVLQERVNPAFESLFAVGVDEMHWDESSERFAWPAVSEVREYRNRVRTIVDEVISTLPMRLPITQADPFWAVWMGIEHERIHIETSSVLHRQMPLQYVRNHPAFPRCAQSGDAPYNSLVAIPGGKVTLGKGSEEHGLYGWDNEYGRSEYEVGDFEVSKYLVSNGEFLEFVRQGGYLQTQWWDGEGQKYLSIRGALCPPFWVVQNDGSYKLRTLCEEIDLPYNWPVEVNALEAQAYCRWKSSREGKVFRLPSEAEWYRMVSECGMDSDIYDDSRANLNFAHYASSVPVDTYAHGEVFDAIGNVWQWTQTPIEGFGGFKPHPLYDDFSTPTFDGKHNLIKGGSWASTGNEIVATSRYAFRRHFTQHAGFRYVCGGEKRSDSGDDNVIADDEIARLCHEAFGEGETFALEAFLAMNPYFKATGSVLELGCKAGRLSLELSRNFQRVEGMDRSARYIVPPVRLLEEGMVSYRFGGRTSEVRLDSLNLPAARDRVAFYQGDRHNLKPHVRGYDCIIVNLCGESSINAEEIARSLQERLKGEDGVVLIVSDEPAGIKSEPFSYLRGMKNHTAYISRW